MAKGEKGRRFWVRHDTKEGAEKGSVVGKTEIAAPRRARKISRTVPQVKPNRRPFGMFEPWNGSDEKRMSRSFVVVPRMGEGTRTSLAVGGLLALVEGVREHVER